MKASNKSLVLIGMPGCGKTTAGRLTASTLSIDFVDMDQYIEEKYHSTIPELFEKGEDYFRDKESEAARDMSLLPSSVISTGGGIVKREENLYHLKKNGIIVFIDRPVEAIMEDLNAKGRPLLKNNPHAIYELYKERYSLYRKYADYTIENTGSLEELAQKLAQLYKAVCEGGCL